MRNLLIASVAGILFTLGQVLIGRMLARENKSPDIESSSAPPTGRRDEILWITVASGVFVLTVLLCLSVWENRSNTIF